MNPLDHAKRYDLKYEGCAANHDGDCDAFMGRTTDGEWIYYHDPILLAMQEYVTSAESLFAEGMKHGDRFQAARERLLTLLNPPQEGQG